MNSILKVSERASEQIKRIIKNSPPGTAGVLIGIDKSGCNGYSYKLDLINDLETKNYECVKKNEIRVFIDPKATIFLIGSEMDYTTDKLSSRFVFKNPNEKSTCGCGESFGF